MAASYREITFIKMELFNINGTCFTIRIAPPLSFDVMFINWHSTVVRLAILSAAITSKRELIISDL